MNYVLIGSSAAYTAAEKSEPKYSISTGTIFAQQYSGEKSQTPEYSPMR